MSWQSYVDDQLIATGHVQKACIIGLDGSLWATSAGFSMQAQEMTAVAGAAANPASILGGGLMIEGQKYMVLRAEDPIIYVRKGSDGACIAKTNQCILIGWYGEKVQAGQCNQAVEKLGDYLRENGY